MLLQLSSIWIKAQRSVTRNGSDGGYYVLVRIKKLLGKPSAEVHRMSGS